MLIIELWFFDTLTTCPTKGKYVKESRTKKGHKTSQIKMKMYDWDVQYIELTKNVIA
jgi:hypothetical protein